MRSFRDLGEWIAENLLNEVLREIFSDYLQVLGISAAVCALAAAFLALYAARLLIALFRPALEIDWASLDPEDRRVMERSFRDLRIATSLAQKLGEEVAENIEQFTEQIRRLGLYGKHSVWQRVDVEDYELICRIYQTPGMASALAEKLNKIPATSVEEFRRQIIEYQTNKTK